MYVCRSVESAAECFSQVFERENESAEVSPIVCPVNEAAACICIGRKELMTGIVEGCTPEGVYNLWVFFYLKSGIEVIMGEQSRTTKKVH